MRNIKNLNRTQKWLLASALLVVLGVQLNWDPTPSIVARNEMGFHEVEMAQSAPPGSTPAKNSAPAAPTAAAAPAPSAAQSATSPGAVDSAFTFDGNVATVDLHKLDPFDFPDLGGNGAKLVMGSDGVGHIQFKADKSTWTAAKSDSGGDTDECAACDYRAAVTSTLTIGPNSKEEDLRKVALQAIHLKDGKLEPHIAQEIASEEDARKDDATDATPSKSDSKDMPKTAREYKDPCAKEKGGDLISCASDEYNNHLAQCQDLKDEHESDGKNAKLTAKFRACEIKLNQDFQNLAKEMKACVKTQSSVVRVKSTAKAFDVTDDDCQSLEDTAHDIISNSYRSADAKASLDFVRGRLGKELNDMKSDMKSAGYNPLQIQEALYNRMIEETGATPECSRLIGGCRASTMPQGQVCVTDNSGYGASGCTLSGGSSLFSELVNNENLDMDANDEQKLFNKEFFTPYATLAAQSAIDMASRRNLTDLTGVDFSNIGGNFVDGSGGVTNPGGSTIATIPFGHVVPDKRFTPNINLTNAKPIQGIAGFNGNGNGTVLGTTNIVGSSNGLITNGVMSTSGIINSPSAIGNSSGLMQYGTNGTFGANTLLTTSTTGGIYNSTQPLGLTLGSPNYMTNATGYGTGMTGNVMTSPTILKAATGGANCIGTAASCRSASATH